MSTCYTYTRINTRTPSSAQLPSDGEYMSIANQQNRVLYVRYTTLFVPESYEGPSYITSCPPKKNIMGSVTGPAARTAHNEPICGMV